MKRLILYLVMSLLTTAFVFANASTDEGEIKQPLLNIQVGETVLTATLEENPSAQALIGLLEAGPITIDMHDYGNMEKVGDLGETLVTNDRRITTEPGDLILYQGRSFVLYYAPNTWRLTRLGKIHDLTTDALLEILGAGDVTVTLSLEIEEGGDR